MFARLNPAEEAAARRWMSGPDVSVDGRFSARVVKDDVVLSDGTHRDVPLRIKRYHPQEASVSDDGHVVAFLGQDPKTGKAELAMAEGGKVTAILPDASSCHSPEVSADGSKVAYVNTYDVGIADRAGHRDLAAMPTWMEKVKYLPGGLLLGVGSWDGWGVGRVPVYYAIDETGHFDILSISDAESLGAHVTESLSKEYRCSYAGATPEQLHELMSRFGYNTPAYRVVSPDTSRMIFRIESGLAPQDTGCGAYLWEAGRGGPRLLEDASLGSRKLDDVFWSDAGTRAAALFADGPGDARLAAVEGDGSRFRPLNVPFAASPDGRDQPLAWSPDRRFLAFDARDGDRTHVYCYDSQEDKLFPVLAEAHVLGWSQDRIQVRLKDGQETTVPARSIDPQNGLGLVLEQKTHPAEPPGTVTVEDGFVQIGDVKLSRHPEETCSKALP